MDMILGQSLQTSTCSSPGTQSSALQTLQAMQCLWWAWAPLSLVCMHARHFTQEVPMNFREWEGLPVSPQPLWQAVPENCRSVINVPVSRGPPSGIRLPGQVDLVSKLGSASCWRLAVRRGKISKLQVLPAATEGTRQSTLAQPI